LAGGRKRPFPITTRPGRLEPIKGDRGSRFNNT
jgi:hypothetical protein